MEVTVPPLFVFFFLSFYFLTTSNTSVQPKRQKTQICLKTNEGHISDLHHITTSQNVRSLGFWFQLWPNKAHCFQDSKSLTIFQYKARHEHLAYKSVSVSQFFKIWLPLDEHNGFWDKQSRCFKDPTRTGLLGGLNFSKTLLSYFYDFFFIMQVRTHW